VAFERGPLVYCFEGVDLPAGTSTAELTVRPGVAARPAGPVSVAGQPVIPLRVPAGIRPAASGRDWPYQEAAPAGAAPGSAEVQAVPYYAWANRGPTDMRVWAPVQP
jgi:hypothetical protein